MTATDPAQRPSAHECASALHALDTSAAEYATLVVPRPPAIAEPAPVPLPVLTTGPGSADGRTATVSAVVATHIHRKPLARPRTTVLAAGGFAAAVAAGLVLMLGAPGTGVRPVPGQVISPGTAQPAATPANAAPGAAGPSPIADVTTSTAVAPPPAVAAPPPGPAHQPKPATAGKAKGHGGGKGHGSGKAGK